MIGFRVHAQMKSPASERCMPPEFICNETRELTGALVHLRIVVAVFRQLVQYLLALDLVTVKIRLDHFRDLLETITAVFEHKRLDRVKRVDERAGSAETDTGQVVPGAAFLDV